MNNELGDLKVLNIVDYDDKYFDDIVDLFKNTVTNVNSMDYSIDEIVAWINIDEDKWRRTLKSNICLVGLYDDEVVGFGDISERGYLDRLYIKDKYINKNIGREIVAKLEGKVKILNVDKIVTYASITSMHFFSSIGFDLVEMNLVRRGPEKLINYRMEKKL